MSSNLDEDASDSENEFETWSSFYGRELIIFLIDAFLFEDKERFEECFTIIRHALLKSLFIRNNDVISVAFCNTKESPEPRDVASMRNIVVPENCAVFLPLKPLSKDIVDYYLNFINSDYSDFENTYGIKEGSFSKAIWLCTKMFRQSGYKTVNSTICFFTDRDNPHPSNNAEFQKAIQKAKDLLEIDVKFSLVPMKDDFNYQVFYKEFICTVRDAELDEFGTIVLNPKEERNLFANQQISLDFRKHCNGYLKWTLGENLKISVGLYNYYRRNVYPKPVTILREDNSIVQVKHVHKIEVIDPETNETSERYCRPGDERKVINIGGKDVIFTANEICKITNPLPPGLTLLGFKPRSSISIHNFVKSSMHLYPDEKTISGSTKLFRALWEKCLEKQKVPICVLVSRRRSRPHYVALVPVEATDEENNDVSYIQNDGFRVVFLPYEDNYRNLDFSDWSVTEVSEEGIELFEKILKKFRMKNFAPTLLKDPALETLLENLTALTFNLESESDNVMEANYQEQCKIMQQFSNKLKETFGEDQVVTKKRGAGDETVRTAKVPKVIDDCPSRDQIEDLIATNNLNQLTVKQLKAYLQVNNVKGVSGAAKPGLIQKIIDLHS